ncbi:MAG: hypothetical protein M3X11_25915, partial [Acidobacteriota bacterium]|nr:hypothetical protein [Acidobacteriota bacterium]
ETPVAQNRCASRQRHPFVVQTPVAKARAVTWHSETVATKMFGLALDLAIGGNTSSVCLLQFGIGM